MQRLQWDAEQWPELNRLLDAALDLPAAERESWLESLDSRYEGFKPQLRELLSRAARVETADFLRTLPKLEPGSSEVAQAGADSAGACIGPYRLIRELGAGGMGSVWLAERTDGLVRRPVALKLPHVVSSRVGLAERLAREREILASLTHPNIARLYDAGVTAEGRPYLALEYVEGEPIDAYCEKRDLDVRARLRLFLQVANAVAYAHAKLIIHRDLKPANILVTSEGGVRLLDFGVAKLLDEGQAKATALTELAGRALTPDYASPEQILGQPLTIATDVYSLGVVLYELLTGARPYKLTRDSRGALEDAIVQAEAIAPSASAPKRQRRQIKGDLDAIVLTALRKEPLERYATVNALADDVRRYLDRRPVLAQPDSLRRRAMRFVQRNRAAVIAAIAIALALLGGAAAAIWQARLALAQQARAEEVKEFIAATFRNANPYNAEGKPLGAIDLVREAAERIERIDAARADLRVELLNIMGSALLGLQDTDHAEAVIAQALKEAEQALPREHPQVLESRSQMITVHRFRGRTAEMARELETLLPVVRQRAEMQPQVFVRGLIDSAHLAIDSGKYDEAVDAAREAAVFALANLGDADPETASAWQVLGLALQYAKQPAAALEAAEKGHRLTLRLRGGNEKHPQVINSRSSYARALAENGRLVEGVAELERAIADSQEVLGPDNRMVGFFSQNIVRYQLDLGLVMEALANADRALRILAQHVKPDSFTYGAAVSARGGALLAARRGEAALENLNAAHATARVVLGEHNDVTLRLVALQAAALAILGREAEARERASAVQSASEPGGPTAFWLGATWRLLGDHAAAAKLQRIAIEAADESPRGVRQRMEALGELGLAQLSAGDVSEARASLEKAVSLFARHHVAMSPARSDALIGLARARMQSGEEEDALAALSQADAFWREFDPQSRWAGEAALWLGRCYLALGRTQDAIDALRRSEKLLAGSPVRADAELARLAREWAGKARSDPSP